MPTRSWSPRRRLPRSPLIKCFSVPKKPMDSRTSRNPFSTARKSVITKSAFLGGDKRTQTAFADWMIFRILAFWVTGMPYTEMATRKIMTQQRSIFRVRLAAHAQRAEALFSRPRSSSKGPRVTHEGAQVSARGHAGARLKDRQPWYAPLNPQPSLERRPEPRRAFPLGGDASTGVLNQI